MISNAKKFIKLLKNRSGSPLVEETVLLGIALFAFVTVLMIVLQLIGYAKGKFQGLEDWLW
ncbi:MAG: hypothetical protein KAR35_09055 [Candidatus Heimdallarchaeota archaeon]|nr:hypothetical protein [Candidatus Heimdallarchaeota archaeon]MCK5049504.1 hypothetical protein [Candidatus Heimdallarchaeota archaeon]